MNTKSHEPLQAQGLFVVRIPQVLGGNMKITSAEQLEALKEIIGQQNVDGLKLALKDRCNIWFFQSEDEVRESELDDNEKRFCYKRFAAGETWAGIFRPLQSPHVPGITPCSCHDAHGNPMGGSGGSSGSIH